MRFSEQQEIKFLQLDECPSDLWHQILRLRSDVFVVEQECIYPDPDEEDRSATHVAVLENGLLCAYARLYKKENLHLGRIIVAAPHRGKGLSTQLMETCMEYWKKSDFNTIELSAQVYLSDYYQKFGFTPIGRMYLEDGIPHLRMHKSKES
jgi:ElaA protein